MQKKLGNVLKRREIVSFYIKFFLLTMSKQGFFCYESSFTFKNIVCFVFFLVLKKHMVLFEYEKFKKSKNCFLTMHVFCIEINKKI